MSGLGGLGDRRPLLSIPRASAGSAASSSNNRPTSSVPAGFGNGTNVSNSRPPTAQSIQIQKAAMSEANTVVAAKTLSNTLGGVAPGISQMPRQLPSKNGPTRALPIARAADNRSNFQSESLRNPPLAQTTTPPEWNRVAENTSSREQPSIQRRAPPTRQPTAAAASPQSSPRMEGGDPPAESMDEDMMLLAKALMEMRDSLVKMQAHMSEQTKKWVETEQKLKFEIGEIAKVKNGFAAQASALKAEVDHLRADVGGINLVEKFDTLDQNMSDLKDRTTQFFATLVRDVRVYHQPPLDAFSIETAPDADSNENDILRAGTTVLLMHPMTDILETGCWMRTRLISPEDGSQKLSWLPIVAVPQVLPNNDDVLHEESVHCCTDFRLQGEPTHRFQDPSGQGECPVRYQAPDEDVTVSLG